MARTGENIYKRKDGRWEGRYIKGRRSDGKPVYGYVYARKYHVCRDKLAQARSQHINHKVIKMCGAGKVNDFMAYWLYDIMRPHVKASTFSNYAAILEKWITPHLGNKRLCQVGKEDVQRFIGVLSEHGLSAGTVRNIFRVLSSAMKKAKEYGYIHENPCEGTRLPEPDKKEVRLLTMQEQKQLEKAAGEDKNGFAILLAAYTGLRVGDADGKISLNQQKPSKHAGLRRFGPEKFLQRNNEFMKERPIFYKKPIKTEKDFSTWLRCFYYTTKAVITEYIYF